LATRKTGGRIEKASEKEKGRERGTKPKCGREKTWCKGVHDPQENSFSSFSANGGRCGESGINKRGGKNGGKKRNRVAHRHQPNAFNKRKIL